MFTNIELWYLSQFCWQNVKLTRNAKFICSLLFHQFRQLYPKISLTTPVIKRCAANQRGLFRCILLFNDGHVLQLWSETVAVRKRMILWFPDICLTVEGKPWKKPQPGNWLNRGSNPGPLGKRQRCYPYTTAMVLSRCGESLRFCLDWRPPLQTTIVPVLLGENHLLMPHLPDVCTTIPWRFISLSFHAYWGGAISPVLLFIPYVNDFPPPPCDIDLAVCKSNDRTLTVTSVSTKLLIKYGILRLISLHIKAGSRSGGLLSMWERMQ